MKNRVAYKNKNVGQSLLTFSKSLKWSLISFLVQDSSVKKMCVRIRGQEISVFWKILRAH